MAIAMGKASTARRYGGVEAAGFAPELEVVVLKMGFGGARLVSMIRLEGRDVGISTVSVVIEYLLTFVAS